MTRGNISAAIGFSILIATMLLFAPASSLAQQRRLTAANPVQSDDSERILVLKNGGVMRGRIRTVATGYLVAAPNGYVVMPFEKVHFDADSVEDAWLTMRLKRENPTVASHLTYARWCLSQKLMKGAVRELREALDLDPSNETARLMLRRVDDEMKRQAAEKSGQTRAFVSVEAPRQPDEARSLAGMSPDTAQRFVSQIQPLLLNRCGNARCHGSASTKREFKLEHIRGSGNQRRRIERNLGAVARRIDLARPSQSELLKGGFEVHGGQTVFVGRAGARQLKTLRDWVSTAAAELRPAGVPAAEPAAIENKSDWKELAAGRPAALPQAPSLSNSPSFDLFKDRSDEDREVPDPLPLERPADRDAPPQATLQTAAAASKEELSNLQKILRETAPVNDVFSPDEFNRKYSR